MSFGSRARVYALGLACRVWPVGLPLQVVVSGLRIWAEPSGDYCTAGFSLAWNVLVLHPRGLIATWKVRSPNVGRVCRFKA